ncbi:DUF6300 family protein [Streptomyces sp. NPDC050400]|uniref:DUF6300 family protein n=1 Tax=Streptomyces sp. NPDC050400 TaxID=3365610 RepID=UPI0037B75B5A
MSDDASTDPPHLEEFLLRTESTPDCPRCSQRTILLARYRYSWQNNRGDTVAGFRESVLCRFCDHHDPAAAPLLALYDGKSAFPADKLDVFGTLAAAWVEHCRSTGVDEDLLDALHRCWIQGEL